MTGRKHPDTERIGGPGASHENRRDPMKSREQGPWPEEGKDPERHAPQLFRRRRGAARSDEAEAACKERIIR